MERLWQLFRHDMSAQSGELPDAHGRYRRERLDLALDDTRPDWLASLVLADDAPVGLAVVRGLDQEERVINSFFLVHPVRRGGHGTALVAAIVAEHPGRWAVAFQDTNAAAAAFWPKVAESLDPAFVLEHVAVPHRSDLPPDSWVRFTTEAS
ncbi:GNAT family N-acetyltransferase [Humibacter ginsenosidimutans]|uniref:GNAT family N-acetyltransferase n=2 Tax=Humibacter ginsenosidimutans TaxID=2599293 RepID=A0A5B8MAI4_9MICO|nr:GNAT family N-acetyltransferase [Humibacter ginsenosidimutans]